MSRIEAKKLLPIITAFAEGEKLMVRVPDGRPPEVHKLLGYANTLKWLLKADFMRCLKNGRCLLMI